MAQVVRSDPHHFLVLPRTRPGRLGLALVLYHLFCRAGLIHRFCDSAIFRQRFDGDHQLIVKRQPGDRCRFRAAQQLCFPGVGQAAQPHGPRSPGTALESVQQARELTRWIRVVRCTAPSGESRIDFLKQFLGFLAEDFEQFRVWVVFDRCHWRCFSCWDSRQLGRCGCANEADGLGPPVADLGDRDSNQHRFHATEQGFTDGRQNTGVHGLVGSLSAPPGPKSVRDGLPGGVPTSLRTPASQRLLEHSILRSLIRLFPMLDERNQLVGRLGPEGSALA